MCQDFSSGDSTSWQRVPDRRSRGSAAERFDDDFGGAHEGPAFDLGQAAKLDIARGRSWKEATYLNVVSFSQRPRGDGSLQVLPSAETRTSKSLTRPLGESWRGT